MPNYLPYLGLVCIAGVLFVFIWRKAKNKKVIPFFLCTASLIYSIEFWIFVIFKSYKYHPGVFKNEYFDSVLGASVSNGFIIPLTAVFITVYNLSFWWITLIIGCFIGVEELFVYLGIYQHFWWKTIYTSIGMAMLFPLVKQIWPIICFRMNRLLLRFLTLFFINFAVESTLNFYFSAIFKLVFFHVDWFTDPTRGHVAFASIYVYTDSIFFAAVVALQTRLRWKALLIGGIVIANYLLKRGGIIEFKGTLAFVLFALLQLLSLVILILMHNILLKEAAEPTAVADRY
ncbi:hypothetical protein SAMN05421736_101180 [Evansella caseinilytica]|uniref:Uncharacterized protein n=1 Tax=Evansella caseinilytica TaxID=1503961 RepID=A0A1H3GIC4_9BACI|nr:hypothetical protein [Evansella caseinilytica]SDY03041.1 hypothetical protein SAMN05421736_101180 [Evansella caseinilytica]